MKPINLLCADLLCQQVDAIACPAHKHLIRGRGISAQIYDLAGEQLVQECRKLPDCRLGGASLTHAHRLPARYIIHTVTPQWSSGDQWGVQALQQLRQCYESVLQLGVSQGFRRLAFPALGAGTNRIPQTLAARVGLECLLEHSDSFEQLSVCLRTQTHLHEWQEAYQILLAQKTSPPSPSPQESPSL